MHYDAAILFESSICFFSLILHQAAISIDHFAPHHFAQNFTFLSQRCTGLYSVWFGLIDVLLPHKNAEIVACKLLATKHVPSIACKQAPRMGCSEICFRIVKGCVRGESLQWSLYDLSSASFSDWLVFHFASLLDSTKIATVAHSNRKTRTTQANILVKKSLHGNIFSERSLRDSDKKITSAGWKWERKKKQSRLHN